jgi:hypothetical protein
MSTDRGGRHRITRGGPPSVYRSKESVTNWPAVVPARVRAQLRAVRDDWAAISRWVRIRRLVLPALLGWGPALLGGA